MPCAVGPQLLHVHHAAALAVFAQAGGIHGHFRAHRSITEKIGRVVAQRHPLAQPDAPRLHQQLRAGGVAHHGVLQGVHGVFLHGRRARAHIQATRSPQLPGAAGCGLQPPVQADAGVVLCSTTGLRPGSSGGKLGMGLPGACFGGAGGGVVGQPQCVGLCVVCQCGQAAEHGQSNGEPAHHSGLNRGR
jgi:hypothetical protein